MENRRAAHQPRPYIKLGCLGCLGVTVVVIGGIALAALVLGPVEQNFVQPEIERELLGSVRPDVGSASSDCGVELPLGEATSGESGRIVLDLHGGEFEIAPGEPGQPARIEGNYNAGGFGLSEEFDPQTEGGWTYRITFNREVSWVRMLYGNQHAENRIRITLPRGVPFYLEGNVSTGVSRMELGGLSVLGVDLDLSMGEHSFGFSEPTPKPMERLMLRARMGEFSVEKLGNASPTTIDTGGSMGEFRLDLRGPWKNDSDVTARWKMGECVVRVPEGVSIDAGTTEVSLGASDDSVLRRLPPPPQGAPTMTLDVAGSMGEVRVAR